MRWPEPTPLSLTLSARSGGGEVAAVVVQFFHPVCVVGVLPVVVPQI
jgi:hypothetical protein